MGATFLLTLRSFIMAYSCRIFSNTGFNVVNIPDQPHLLETTGTYTELTALEIVQDRFLSTVNVAATWDTVRDADYCNINDFYYFVTGVSMVAPDVAQLTLVPDFITSAGGALALTILDGLTMRHHVPKDDDTFGAYVQEDPYIVPSKPLVLETAGWKGGDAGNDMTLMISTLDLDTMGSDSYKHEGITYTDPSDKELYVTIPKVPYTSQSSLYTNEEATRSAFLSGITTYKVDAHVLNGANEARFLGVESGIIGQYAVPQGYIETTGTDGKGALTGIKGKSFTFNNGLNFNFANARNKRVLYGALNKYGIITADGNKGEYNPEDIYSGNATSPSFVATADVRQEGRPYFAPSYFHGNTDFWANNPIAGAQWREVPLIFTGKSGQIVDNYHFQSDKNIEDMNLRKGELNLASGVLQSAAKGKTGLGNLVGNTLSLMGRQGKYMTRGANSELFYGSAGTAFGNALQTASPEMAAYNEGRQRELADFQIDKTIRAPEIYLPATTGIRDYVGNNAFCYRYRLSDFDVQKIDKILTMYGYADTDSLDHSMFNNRPEFNYVQATGVSVGGTLPQWWKNGIAAQFGAGVRIWHEKPNVEAYYKNE